MVHKINLIILVLTISWWSHVVCVHFKTTMIKSFLFSDDQSLNQRFQWHGDSALNHGAAAGKHNDVDHPGYDIAAETAAALAAVSVVFRQSDVQYEDTLLAHAIQLFKFACDHQGKYSDSIPIVRTFNSSSKFQEELLWAVAWLCNATNEKTYLDYLGATRDSGGETMLAGTLPFTEHWRFGQFQFRITKHDLISTSASKTSNDQIVFYVWPKFSTCLE